MPASGDAAAVELHGVCKSYGISKGQVVLAADDVNLTISAGSCVAVTGASGSGKSTLLHLLGAMERADAGTIRTGDTDVTALRGRELADYRRTVGFVFQRYNLLPALTALDNVIAPVLPYRTGFDKRERGRELLAAVGLGGREQSLPVKMSGGEQQRVAIARALMNEPALLLADEPTGNLDSANAAEILRLVGELRVRRAVTVIIATHDPHVAACADRMIRLRDGAVVDDMLVIPAEDMTRRVGQAG